MYGDFWTPEQAIARVRSNGGFDVFKYVRVGDEFRFTFIGGPHADCLKSPEERSNAVSAGTVNVRIAGCLPPLGVLVTDYSMRLQLMPAEGDAEKIAALFGTVVRDWNDPLPY